MRNIRSFVLLPLAALFTNQLPAAAAALDFRYSPPQWQTSICLPDDSQKTLVDHTGALLYHYNQGGREFGTRVSVEVDQEARWQQQELHSPRVPIVRTRHLAGDLEIVQEAFAITDLPQTNLVAPLLTRLDGGGVNRNWAAPPPGSLESLRDIAVHMGGNIEYQLAVPRGEARTICLALCEGWWAEPGQRVQTLRIEGAESQTIDTVADLGKNKPGAFWFNGRDENKDGLIQIAIKAAGSSRDKNTIVNGVWAFPALTRPDDNALLSGRMNAMAIVKSHLPAPSGPPRNDVILVRVTNRGSAERVLRPRLKVETAMGFELDPEAQRALINSHEVITSSLRMSAPGGDTIGAVQLEEVRVSPGQTTAFFVLYSAGGVIAREPNTLEEALLRRERAVQFWGNVPLPYDRVQVPDRSIQALFDSSIRNIWQAREIKKGLPAFQVGPTCYRGLWIVDGAFILEAAAILGAGKEARSGVAYELTFQQPDGRIQVMNDFSKENGIVLWTCVRHAQLTQDQEWLRSVWPRLEKIAVHIQSLRAQTLTNASPLDDGLLPAGFPDGGIGGVHDEYTNPYWNLAGLRAFAQAARWLGNKDCAKRWEREYQDFLAAYTRAAKRDMKISPGGHAYVPTRMDGQDLPQRGQWAFCHAVYPGQIFSKDDAVVASTLAMLRDTEQEGMVYGTGWDATGIWNYFASFYGHAWLWQGNGSKAADVLAAFAHHASPTLVWREEQSLTGREFRKVGDMPHNWASAEFIRLTVHLLAFDRGDELHLLRGLPRAWTGPGMVTRLSGIATPFGPLEMSLKVNPDGGHAALSVEPLSKSCKSIVVHLPGGGIKKISPRRGGVLSFPTKY